MSVRGGLGNQLFCYFAGEYIRTKFKIPVIYIMIKKSNPHNLSDIRDLEFLNMSMPIYTWPFIRISFAHLTQIIKNFLTNFFYKGLSKPNIELFFDTIHDEKNVDFEEQINVIQKVIYDNRSKRIYIRGLFQDFRYIDYLSKIQINIKKPSDEFKYFKSRLAEVRPIVVHMRLGDYLTTNLGILSHKYYKEAILKLEQQNTYSEIWIITNQVEKAKEILGPINDKRYRFEINSKINNPVELLMIMASANSLIISNSTFSLWAAKLSNPECTVIYPKNFFRNGFFLESNFKDSWFSVNADWLM